MISTLSMENPVFVAYAIAAALMVLKIMAQGWATVALMLKADAGVLNPRTCGPHLQTGIPDPSNSTCSPMSSVPAECTATTLKASQPSSRAGSCS